jgi:hypothetical protein
MTTPKTEEDLVTGYRSAAEECQQQAARSATGLHRDHWLKIADEWITLAEEAGLQSVKSKRAIRDEAASVGGLVVFLGRGPHNAW